jgi:hypothetical protein
MLTCKHCGGEVEAHSTSLVTCDSCANDPLIETSSVDVQRVEVELQIDDLRRDYNEQQRIVSSRESSRSEREIARNFMHLIASDIHSLERHLNRT